ncbi:hypothetical protein [Herpetosiphon gulosus]|uniref:Uncharacterized protein n=1 Tax=Herpetosiphon gulosus TaxID=1973496 RepID=A0ABP9WVF4_9CHLR
MLTRFLKPLALVGLILIMPAQVKGQPHINNVESPQSVNQVVNNPNCTAYERAWGDWCVYTFTDAVPDKVVNGFANIYHASAWYEDNKWQMVVGGWRTATQDHDHIFKLSSTDQYGVSSFNQVGTTAYINNAWETTASADCPPANPYLNETPKPCPVSGTSVRSYHSVQPDLFSMKWTRPRPAGWTCCDTLYYAYDIQEAHDPEQNVAIHYAWIDANGILQRGGMYGDKNPILNWHIGSTNNRYVTGTSDARVTYDPATQKFYMIYTDHGFSNILTNPVSKSFLSIAQSNWTNLAYTNPVTNILPWVGSSNVNGQIVVTGNNPYEYYLFYTVYPSSNSDIWVVKSSGGITGPYEQQNAKKIISPVAPYKVAGTPYVFCNTAINPPQWQMYFNGATTATDNQIFTAFLHKTCEYDANNPTVPSLTPPVLP